MGVDADMVKPLNRLKFAYNGARLRGVVNGREGRGI
jgi:hypothetical protein